MSGILRDDLALALQQHVHGHTAKLEFDEHSSVEETFIDYREAIDAVLASDNMQAIRKALLHASDNAARHAYPDGRPDLRLRRYLKLNCFLSDAAIDWVMDGEQ